HRSTIARRRMRVYGGRSAVFAGLYDVRQRIATERAGGAGDASARHRRGPLPIGAEAHLFRSSERASGVLCRTRRVKIIRNLAPFERIRDGIAPEIRRSARHRPSGSVGDLVGVLAVLPEADALRSGERAAPVLVRAERPLLGGRAAARPV